MIIVGCNYSLFPCFAQSGPGALAGPGSERAGGAAMARASAQPGCPCPMFNRLLHKVNKCSDDGVKFS
jgi:hypothetical protein